ncbi:MAG: hypothetical protein AAFQ53_00085 [Bacteroidota bacterium]
MPSFLCLQRPLSGEADASLSTEAASSFEEWFASNGSHVEDMGGRFRSSQLASGAEVVRPVAEMCGGFMLLTADTLEDAIRIAASLPGLVGSTSTVEVIEVVRPDA